MVTLLAYAMVIAFMALIMTDRLSALLALILQRLGLPKATIITAAKRLARRGGFFVPV